MITVWCTGCTGFEPIVSVLSGASGVMECSSSMSAVAVAVSDRGDTSSIESSEASPRPDGYDCGCGSCHAVTVVALAEERFSPTRPMQKSVREDVPLSITRAPLIPPPQRDA